MLSQTNLKNKKASYFKQLKSVDYSKLSKKQVRELVKRSYEALSETDKAWFVGGLKGTYQKEGYRKKTDDIKEREFSVTKRDLNQYFKDMVNTLSMSGKGTSSPYRIMMAGVKHNKWEGVGNPIDDIYTKFRTSPETQNVYFVYNNYMVAQGQSASKWFKNPNNSTRELDGPITTIVVTLPSTPGKRVIKTLTVVYNGSAGNEFIDAYFDGDSNPGKPRNRRKTN